MISIQGHGDHRHTADPITLLPEDSIIPTRRNLDVAACKRFSQRACRPKRDSLFYSRNISVAFRPFQTRGTPMISSSAREWAGCYHEQATAKQESNSWIHGRSLVPETLVSIDFCFDQLSAILFPLKRRCDNVFSLLDLCFCCSPPTSTARIILFDLKSVFQTFREHHSG